MSIFRGLFIKHENNNDFIKEFSEFVSKFNNNQLQKEFRSKKIMVRTLRIENKEPNGNKGEFKFEKPILIYGYIPRLNVLYLDMSFEKYNIIKNSPYAPSANNRHCVFHKGEFKEIKKGYFEGKDSTSAFHTILDFN